jgi:hypothetical protein
MVPTHVTKAGIRYRYYISLPHLYGESKTAKLGSVSRIPAPDIEDVIVKSLGEHPIAKENPSSSITHLGDRKTVLEQVARIDVHKDHLTIRFKSDAEETSNPADGHTAPTREFGRHVFDIAALLRVFDILYNYRVRLVGVMGIELVTPSLFERKTTTKTFSHHGSQPRDCSA